MSRVLAALALALLAGCATLTPEERAARLTAEAATLKAEYGPACDALGYARDSDAWRNCLLALANRDACERAAREPAYWYTPPWFYRPYPPPPRPPAPKPAS
jgi:hypothetical protein